MDALIAETNEDWGDINLLLCRANYGLDRFLLDLRRRRRDWVLLARHVGLAFLDLLLLCSFFFSSLPSGILFGWSMDVIM
jgi:hypothetical protein